MKWSKVLKRAIPVWLLVCAVVIAINYLFESRVLPFQLIVTLAAAYPLIAFILKATAEDFAKWRAAFGSKDDE